MKAYLALALACAILGASVFPEVAANTAREVSPTFGVTVEIFEGSYNSSAFSSYGILTPQQSFA